MPNLYNVPLQNNIQRTLANTLNAGETSTITFSTSVSAVLQASASIPGLLVIDRVDANGTATPSLTEYISFTGVSGSTVTGLTRGLAGSSDISHSVGAIVEFVPDVTWAQAINDVFTTQHNSDGTHKPFSGMSLASSAINNSSFTFGSLTSTSIITSNIDTFSFRNINGPEGYLINGKIVPSVASNNLTVAIKTLAGNDASASDPIYVRIGDNVRTITGALSVTLNAGTNWFNSGSTELATREVDYFVYLGDDAGTVRIGFGRIPFANRFEDYSATTTDEKHIAFNTALSAGEACTVIGRFGATLSDGAGYTWTVPTFNTTNLIQRPIFISRWLDYSGTLTSTAPSLASTVYITRKYKVISDTVNLDYWASSVLGGSAGGNLIITVPFNLVTSTNVQTYGTGTLNTSAGTEIGLTMSNNATSFSLRRPTSANYPTSGTVFLNTKLNYPIY